MSALINTDKKSNSDENNKALINFCVLEFISNITRSVLAPIFPVFLILFKLIIIFFLYIFLYIYYDIGNSQLI